MIEHVTSVRPAMTARKAMPKDPLMKAAKQLETAFIAEMLHSAGLGKPRAEFGGGAGEEAFSSFLVLADAKAMTAARGFGLAEKVYQSFGRRR